MSRRYTLTAFAVALGHRAEAELGCRVAPVECDGPLDRAQVSGDDGVDHWNRGPGVFLPHHRRGVDQNGNRQAGKASAWRAL